MRVLHSEASMHTSTRLQRAFVTFLVATWAAGCGAGASKVGEQPSWRKPAPADDRKADARSRDTATAGLFAPATPAVGRYNDPPRSPAPSAPLADAIVAAIGEVSAASGVEPPLPDGRLFAAARELAEIVPADAPLSYRLVEFALHRHGIIEPSPQLVVIWGPIEDPAPVMSKLRDRLPELVASGPFVRVGVGSAQRGEGDMGATILALQASHLETKPIPRSLPKGGTIRLEGKLRGPFRDPQVFVTRETGMVEQPELHRTGSSRFHADVGCLRHVGRQQIEITAVDSSGSTVLANFPVWCNAEPPTSIPLDDGGDLAVASAEEAEERLVELVNRDRKQYGLPPLEVHESTRAVARAHSQEMHDTGVVAHISPTTGSASDRIRVAGIKTSVVLENVARAYGVREAEEGLMNSPGHRANILTTQANRIGVGVVVGEEIEGRRELFVTQLFIHVTPRIAPNEAKKALHAKIQAVRKLSHDDALAALAQRYAEDVAGGMSTKDASKRATRGAEQLASRYSRATTVVVAVGSVDAFSAKSALVDENMTSYGLGVAQGPHPELGERAIYVVLILAKRR